MAVIQSLARLWGILEGAEIAGEKPSLPILSLHSFPGPVHVMLARMGEGNLLELKWLRQK
jgi:hypothetical protein